MTMKQWKQIDPYNLDYIEQQVKAIKENHNITNDNKTDQAHETTRKIEDILEEQLSILQHMQHTLDKIEASTTKKGWKNLF